MCRTAPQVVAISLFVAMPCIEPAVNAAESSGGVSKTSTRFAWEEALETLRQRQHVIRDHLVASQKTLIARAKKENAEFVKRLYLKPPLRGGYSILPEIRDDGPITTVIPRKNYFRLKKHMELSRDYVRSVEKHRSAILLTSSILEDLVGQFERLRKRLRNLEVQHAYHSKWQRAVIDYSRYFNNKNKSIKLIDKMHALIKSGQKKDQISDLEKKVRKRVGVFRLTPGLTIKQSVGGINILPVTVVTDINDEDFLATFRNAVETAFVHSEAAKSTRVIHGEDTESADARVGDWCGLVARRWVFEEAGAACGSRSLARICAIAGIAVECG